MVVHNMISYTRYTSKVVRTPLHAIVHTHTCMRAHTIRVHSHTRIHTHTTG